MIKIIISMCKRIFLIFHDLITFYKNFMTLIYQENNVLGNKINVFLISNLKYIYLQKKIMNA